MTFKFDSTTFFLTYAQAGDLDWDQIINHIAQIKDIDWLRICKELHQDGEPHYHVVGKFSGRVQSRNERLFDVEGKHPNIQQIRSIKRALQYVTKDGEFRDIGAVPAGSNEDINWVEVASHSTEADYYKLACKERLPFMYAKKFWDLGAKTPTHEVTDTYEPDLSRECFELLVHVPDPILSTVVIGPSGCGKTSWSKRVCVKPALWVRHMDVLRTFRAGYHKSIIFDDMAFQHLPREAQIHIVDSSDEAHIHCRYGYAIIPAGVHKIFTANAWPFMDDPAINRRIYKIEVQGYTI